MDRFGPGKIALGHMRERAPVSIVGDAGIATIGLGERRMISLLILDAPPRPDLEEFIRLHELIPVGDVVVRWAKLDRRPDTIALTLRLLRPAELTAIIEFDLVRHHAVLVEQILVSRGLYLQAGRPGDRLIDDPDRPKVILEVPDAGFRRAWNRLFEKYALKKMRAEGMRGHDAKRATQTYVEATRKTARLQISG